MPEARQLEVIKEVGFCHTRIADGCASLVQLTGMVARLCQLAEAGSRSGRLARVERSLMPLSRDDVRFAV